ncbi:putative flavoprotein involved in K+ transport [Agromyces ramosus]|uniref:Putative flavoprotein involved in K+ transport n=1 Tax=Agromyces ramosus TaxID=33879 RepID=A0A4Q7ME02_9MICO|nr:NAD(P)/FAD-dependent oxidoreductase [Agromyces ramosus]RZS64589.1 putative flavoprotein involved in K+ transport [Agromyces ramosus]
MSTTVLRTAVVGAGAAGLIVGKRLAEQGVRFELFDDHVRVGDSWRDRYRSLRLFTPRSLLSLPGLRIDVGRFAYPTGAQMGDYLERYAEHFGLPVRTSSRVVELTRLADGGFRLQLGDGDEVLAEHVIVTSGAHRVPIVPAFASELDPSIRQLHSVDYRGPEQLAAGPVLVVGAANSGTDVALDAAGAGHVVTLAGRHPGHVPFDIDTPISNLVGGIFVRYMRSITIDSARGRAMRAKELAHGVMLVRNKPADLARAGVVRVGRIDRVEAGRPLAADGTAVDAATVVWCTGSRPDLGWIDIAGVVGDDGLPTEHRGLATGCPGLAFVGMPFQYSVASSTLVGMDRDAAYVLESLGAGRDEPVVDAPRVAA